MTKDKNVWFAQNGPDKLCLQKCYLVNFKQQRKEEENKLLFTCLIHDTEITF
jgi:hypothetical protein